jgi:hypothetical protein
MQPLSLWMLMLLTENRTLWPPLHIAQSHISLHKGANDVLGRRFDENAAAANQIPGTKPTD